MKLKKLMWYNSNMISEIVDTEYSDEIDLKIFDLLIDYIRENRKQPNAITYSALTEKVDTYSVVPVNIGYRLGRVSNFCRDNGAPVISAIVGSLEHCEPSAGFFELLGMESLPADKRLEVWMPIFNAVYEYPLADWQKLRDKFAEQIKGNKKEEA